MALRRQPAVAVVVDIAKEVLKANSFKDFNPMQKAVLDRPWQEKSMVVSAPTAAGKTVVAELLALNSIIKKKKKVVYVCPLKAIASEHYRSFKRKYSDISVRAALTTGDLDVSSKHLSGYDIIFSTYEKIDSIIRHREDWLSSVGLLIVDEIHSLGSNRGPTLEIMISALRLMNKSMQVLGLSATIPNSKEIAEWLDANLVDSDYRPVKLTETVYFDGILYNGSPVTINEKGTPIESIVSDTLEKKKQLLVFANTRKRSQDYAKKLAYLTSEVIDSKTKDELEREAAKILTALESPTEQCRLLAELVKQGVAFHHAGLMNKQREIVEDAFKKNLVKVVSSTPTLAAGINMPAFRVIISSVYRYTSFGNQRIPVSEYKQMSGRAGRPDFDDHGESVLIAKSEAEKDELQEFYVRGKPEEIYSQLSHEPVLRVHLLSAIANGFVFDLLSLEEFLEKTFYYVQNPGSEILEKVNPVLRELHEMGFLDGDENRFEATPLGKRVSQLYLDPQSAYTIINSLKENPKNELFYLYLVANTSEFLPWVPVSRQKEEVVWQELMENASSLPINVEKEQFEDHNILAKFNASLLLLDWINENSEEELLKAYNVQPGVVHSKLERADWLIYSAFELARLLNYDNHYVNLQKIRKRLKYGIREELLPLVSVKYIGRVRARRIFRAGIKTLAQLKKTDIQDLSRVIGQKIAEKIKSQI